MNALREEESPEHVRCAYAKATSKVKSVLRKEKRKFEKGIAAEAKTKPKFFWAHARRKLNTKVGVSLFLAIRLIKTHLNLKTQKRLIFCKLSSQVYLQKSQREVFQE